MRNPLNDIEAFAAVSGGLSMGLGIAALLTASAEFLAGAAFIGAASLVLLAASGLPKIKKSGAVVCKPTEPESKSEPCGSTIMITEFRGVVKENGNEKM